MTAFDDGVAEGEGEDFKPLSREEAKALSQKLRSQQAPLSLLRVLVWQAVTGLLLASCVWVWSGNSSTGWSVLYGSLCVVVPAAIFARGFGRQMAFGQSGTTVPAGAAMAGFFIWELVKVVLTVAMLLAAPKMVVQLNWLALLAGFVVTMKVYWVAAWLGLGRKSQMKK
ncbi:MAG: ATP synthase subunit I [Pseudomonadota bacterium]